MIYECPDSLKNKRLLSVDIETTGLNTNYNTIIELGVIEVLNGRITGEYTKLFGGGYSPMYLLRNVHHIKDSERRYKPRFEDCAEKICNYLSDSVIITHNGKKFDIPMIETKLEKAGGYKLSNVQYIDTYQIAKKIGHESNTLSNLCKLYNLQYGGEDGNNAHRGLEDAFACLQLFYYFIISKKFAF